MNDLRRYLCVWLIYGVLPQTLLAEGEQRLSEFRRVLIADDAGAVQKAAADELVHYIGMISGRPLQRVRWSEYVPQAPGLSVFVGGGVARQVLGEGPGPWKDEEWMLRTVPGGLVVAGHDGDGDPWSLSTPAGSMLAAYTLLDDYLGTHWFWPGPFGEHVPSRPDAAIPALNLRQSPRFAIRSIQLGYTRYHTRAFSEAGRRWSRRSRLGWVRSAVFGHSWDAAFEQRKGQTFSEHPEWFALVDGRRRPPQMCTTNPRVIERMVDFVVEGKLAIGNISPSDGGGFCECEACVKLDVPGVLGYDGKHVQLSDRIFTYANEVARRVRERDPQKGVGMFAYTLYNRPPVHISALEPNLYLSFVYQSAAHRDPRNLAEWRASVAGWKRLDAKMVVREGWGNHYYFDLPFLHPRQIIANLAEAEGLGFMAAYGEGSKNFATQAPNYWAITQMMWDPRRDAAEIMPEFYRSAYGPAAAAMEAFFATYDRALDDNWSKLDRHVDTSQIAYANLVGAWRRVIPETAVREAEKHLEEAERLAPAGEYADRIAFHRFGQQYTRVMLELLETYRQLGELGVKLDTWSSNARTRRDDPEERQRLLRRALDLGQQREELLLAHRDWAGPDEGLYAYTNDAGIRRWHAQVKQVLGIDSPSAVTGLALGVNGR
jgi:hypothetical protein